MDDRELLSHYVGRRSQDAFRQLVERHLPMVYSTARRIVLDSHLAEEVAQSVFSTLAQKADVVRPPQVIGGWLYNTTRHLALNAVRTEQRRREREQTALAMQTLDLASDDPRLAEHLEPAMAELDADDRDALVLRYLENRSLREVGAELCISEDAARMRVNRALERLRTGFERQGGAVTTVLLATAITATTTAAPAGLGGAIATTALSKTTVAATTAAVLSTAPTFGIVKWLIMTKLKTSLLIAVLAIGIATLLLVRKQSSHQSRNVPAAASANVEANKSISPFATRPSAVTNPIFPEENAEIASLKKILYSPVSDGIWPSTELRIAILGFGQGTDVLVKLLIEAQETGNHEARMRAMSSLALLGPKAREALPAILKLIDKPAEDASTILRFAVQVAREPAFAKDLVELYRSAAPNGSAPGGYYPELKDTLRNAPLSGAVLEALQQLMRNNRNEVVQNATSSVGEILVGYLKDSDPDIRILAAQALAQFPAKYQAAAVTGFASVLTQRLPDSARSTLNRQTAAIHGLAAFRQSAAPAVPTLQSFIDSTPYPSLRKLAEEAITSISTPAATAINEPFSVSSPTALQLVDEEQTALAGKVFNETATVLELGLVLTNSNQRARIKAVQTLGGMGKGGAGALPQLQQALQTADEVFKELLLLTHREIAPDGLQPLYRKEDLLPALRAVSDELAKTPQSETIQTEINRASRSFFYDHAQIVSLANKIGTHDSRLRESFVRKLVEIEPPLAVLFKTKP